jgi:hypothetical protein
MSRKNWGKSTLKYCPVNKKVWQQKRNGDIVTYIDMPTYGLNREEIPNGLG